MKDKQLKDIITFGSLNIGYGYDRAETYDNLEIDIVNIEKDREVDMLEEHFLDNTSRRKYPYKIRGTARENGFANKCWATNYLISREMASSK